MKTNFNYLENILDNINNTISKEYRYIRDFNFILREVEKNIYLREFINANYNLRLAQDLSKEFIDYMIKNSNVSFMKDWSNNLKSRMKPIINSYKSKNKHYNYRNPGFTTLFEEYPSTSDDKINGLGTMEEAIDMFHQMNSWMHYRFDRNYTEQNTLDNINDHSTFFIHRGDIRFREPSMDKIIKYLSAISLVTLKVMNLSDMFQKEENVEFDLGIYNDIQPMVEKFLSNSIINQFIYKKRKCPICGEGEFKKPNIEEINNNDNIKFPHGPYISCNHPGCWAKIDSTMKAKAELKYNKNMDSTCPSCMTSEALQLRVNLNEGRGNYIYKACKHCNWNSKNNNDKDIDEIVSLAEDETHLLFD